MSDTLPPEWEWRIRNVAPQDRERAIGYLIQEQEIFRMCAERGITFVRRDGKLVTRKRASLPEKNTLRKDGFVVWQQPSSP